jgi:hypothetical protein
LKNRERDGVTALSGHLLVGQHNNQPKVGIRGRRDIGEGAQPGRNTWGGHRTIVWGSELSHKKNKKTKKIKICCSLKWPPINISNATTNQKHVGVMEERKA